ncbi:tRNA lysidine(34) synthetase TilS [Methylobacterium mesophilicum SR1.6/6]|uniref:tRNA(Ile)-lysidine synthase n=1 Tax=Methylobacterium mesophilicum SR1.6/6 TaxID=908290 RepID=A0A6B9FJL9_9HYPH|nr:tRNA lysidine(34) synthetase TilS [Methylobacterium mesophilicum]QGY01375.1 tRNA lysidine(34) synthetase TilS [Methylobacterium mesophilicum SR1.6/6]
MSGAGDPLRDAIAPWLERSARHGRAVLLAVSGGPDSSALMHAAAALAHPGTSLRVATVDHGLRPTSGDEVEGVARAADRLGLPHTTLRWTGPKPGSGLQDAAREARYALLSSQAAAIGAGLVLTGHTRDDQAETVLMRLAAGSGLAGLAGMRAERNLAPEIVLGRPFLHLPKATLVAWCEARGIPVLRDPTNADPRFARGRLRDAWPALEREGLSAARLARLAERAARDEAALRSAAERALATALRPGTEQGATLRLDGARLAALPEAVALRCVDLALSRAGAAPRRLDRLEALVLESLLPALRRNAPIRRTLAGILIASDAAATVSLAPAPPRRHPQDAALAAGDPRLLGKGGPPAYIGEVCTDGPAEPGDASIRGPHTPGIDR